MESSAAQTRASPSPGAAYDMRGPNPCGPLTLDEIASRIRTVPVAPEVFPKLQVALNDLDTEVSDVSKLIKLDAGLASSMLKTANSAYFAGRESVVDVEDAISRIGFDESLRLVVRCSYASVLRGELSCYGIPGDRLWCDAVIAAFAMEQLSARTGIDRSAGYVIGLLHAVGMAGIDDFLKTQSLRAPRFTGSGRKAMIEWEMQTIGFSHADVGGAMLRKWQMPAAIVDAVEKQLETTVCDDLAMHAVILPVALQLGEYVLAVSDEGENPVAPMTPQFDSRRLERAGLDAEKLAEVTEAVLTTWQEARELMR